jgi:predicted methyltransferase MtxX (methanogen marker protein 4)
MCAFKQVIYHYGDQITEDCMGAACTMHLIHVQILLEKILKERDHLGKQGIYINIIFKCILQKQVTRMHTKFI